MLTLATNVQPKSAIAEVFVSNVCKSSPSVMYIKVAVSLFYPSSCQLSVWKHKLVMCVKELVSHVHDHRLQKCMWVNFIFRKKCNAKEEIKCNIKYNLARKKHTKQTTHTKTKTNTHNKERKKKKTPPPNRKKTLLYCLHAQMHKGQNNTGTDRQDKNMNQ